MKFNPKWLVFLTLALAFATQNVLATPPEKPPTEQAAGSKHWENLKPEEHGPDGFGESVELVKLGSGEPAVAPDEDGLIKMIPVRYFRRSPNAKGAISERDPVLQASAPLSPNTPSPNSSFDGIGNLDGYTPPDTVGAIGPSNFVQAVNVRVQVFNRFTGAAQTAALPISSLFSSLGAGSFCASTDDGDPVVVYDQYADRWIVAQFANADALSGPYYMSIAVSKTSDPTGAYYAYCFQTPGTVFPDYPKIGVWPDGYYLSVNQFDGNTSAGAGVYAFDRLKMLAGDPSAKYIYFNLANTDSSIGSLLPASAEGPPPPLGTPNYFTYIRGVSLGDPSNDLRVFEFHADFSNTNLSTFTERAESPIAVAAYTAFSPSTAAVPQPNTSVVLDTLADRLMFRLQYRNFGSYESLVVTHTATGGSGQAAIRYYQLKRNFSGGSFAINEQATYAPDAAHRWMGSAAMNYHGDLAVGYSVSSSSIYPSVRYAARLASDPPNGLFQGEATMVTGGGAQLNSGGRWGDYSCMTIDPVDDCTFWYTQEYYSATSDHGWKTRIGSFSLPGCTAAPKATISGTVTRFGTGAIVSNAVVRLASGYVRLTGTNGAYSMTLTPGVNDITAEAAGIGTNTVSAVVVTNGESRVLNFIVGSPTVDVLVDSYALVTEGCANGAVDPGETVTVNLTLHNYGFLNTTNLVVTLQAGNGVTSPSAPQTYGAMTSSSGAVTRSFSFTASGTCGGSIMPTFQLQDGTASYGTRAISFSLGVVSTALQQNFDGVAAPSLPSGWTTTVAGSGLIAWVTSTAQKDTSPNSAFVADVSTAGTSDLVSPVIAIPTGSPQLTFRHYYNLEASSTAGVGYDGGVLEIKIGSGSFTDILTAGGSFAAGGYNRTISSSYSNPLAGRQAWSGNSGGFITTTVNLPSIALGQNAQFRWRCGTDSSSSVTGWYVDSISISGVSCCSGPTAPSIATQPASQTVNSGSNVTFSVIANGTTPFNYQWRYNGGAISSATLSSYSINGVAGSDAGSYNVIVSNSVGTVTSSNAVLVVNAPPSITTQPLSQTMVVGSNVTFSVVASGSAPLKYQWRKDGANVGGATDSAYTRPSILVSDAGSYSVVVTNTLGTVTSSNATLTVITPGPVRLLSIGANPDSTITSTWSVTPSVPYRLAYKSNLLDAQWTALGNYTATLNTLSVTDNPAAATARFYQLSWSTGSTPPTGVIKLPLASNSDTYVSLPFLRPMAAAVTIASIASNVITVSDAPNWATDQFVYSSGVQSNTYYVRFGTGSLEGRSYTITGNGANTIALDLGNDTLAGAASGDVLAIEPYWTPATVFPNGNGVNISPTVGNRNSEVLIPDLSSTGINLSSSKIYYFNNGTWKIVGQGSTDHGDDVLAPGSYFVVRHNVATNTTLMAVGAVHGEKVAIPLRAYATNKQDNFVGLARPVTLTLDDSQLVSSGAFASSPLPGTRTDELLVFDNAAIQHNKSAASVYYYWNSAWRKVGAGSTVVGTDPVFTPGEGVIIRKATNNAPSLWINSPNY